MRKRFIFSCILLVFFSTIAQADIAQDFEKIKYLLSIHEKFTDDLKDFSPIIGILALKSGIIDNVIHNGNQDHETVKLIKFMFKDEPVENSILSSEQIAEILYDYTKNNFSNTYNLPLEEAYGERDFYPPNLMQMALIAYLSKKAQDLDHFNGYLSFFNSKNNNIPPSIDVDQKKIYLFSQKSYNDFIKTLNVSAVEDETMMIYFILAREFDKDIFILLPSDQKNHQSNARRFTRNLFNITLANMDYKIFDIDILTNKFPRLIYELKEFYQYQDTFDKIKKADESRWNDLFNDITWEHDTEKYINSFLQKVLNEPKISWQEMLKKFENINFTSHNLELSEDVKFSISIENNFIKLEQDFLRKTPNYRYNDWRGHQDIVKYLLKLPDPIIYATMPFFFSPNTIRSHDLEIDFAPMELFFQDLNIDKKIETLAKLADKGSNAVRGVFRQWISAGKRSFAVRGVSGQWISNVSTDNAYIFLKKWILWENIKAKYTDITDEELDATFTYENFNVILQDIPRNQCQEENIFDILLASKYQQHTVKAFKYSLMKNIFTSFPDLFNIKNNDGNSALHLAIANQQLEIAEFMLSKIPAFITDLSYLKNNANITPLHLAIPTNQTQLADKILDLMPRNYFELEQSKEFENTYLGLAIIERNWNLVKKIFDIDQKFWTKKEFDIIPQIMKHDDEGIFLDHFIEKLNIDEKTALEHITNIYDINNFHNSEGDRKSGTLLHFLILNKKSDLAIKIIDKFPTILNGYKYYQTESFTYSCRGVMYLAIENDLLDLAHKISAIRPEPFSHEQKEAIDLMQAILKEKKDELILKDLDLNEVGLPEYQNLIELNQRDRTIILELTSKLNCETKRRINDPKLSKIINKKFPFDGGQTGRFEDKDS